MKTLNWRHTDWFGKNFIFSIGQEIIGQLTFCSSWNFNAVYTDKETNLKFAQKSFWDRDATITKDGETIGEINFGLFATQTLKLATGEKFTLVANHFKSKGSSQGGAGDADGLDGQALSNGTRTRQAQASRSDSRYCEGGAPIMRLNVLVKWL